jgi:enoyl-[acyl-carrier-protein] reductase (NADH)
MSQHKPSAKSTSFLLACGVISAPVFFGLAILEILICPGYNVYLNGLGRSLAIELAPIRVNVVSPGWTDTPIWDTMPGMTKQKKNEILTAMAARLPVKHIGRPEGIAKAIIFLMKNDFITGTVLHVDGGHELA